MPAGRREAREHCILWVCPTEAVAGPRPCIDVRSGKCCPYQSTRTEREKGGPMPRFVIDMEDSPQAWSELFRKIERWGEEQPAGWDSQASAASGLTDERGIRRAPQPEEMASFLSALWYADAD